MGNLISCGLGHFPSEDVVKIVHCNGFVKEFPMPLRVEMILDDYPDHFLCRSDDLNIIHHPPKLSDEHVLELGQIYFLLPLNIFQSVPLQSDIAALLAKAALARKSSSRSSNLKKVTRAPAPRPVRIKQDADRTQITVSREFLARILAEDRVSSEESADKKLEPQVAYKNHILAKNWKAWRPRLETIDEASLQVSW